MVFDRILGQEPAVGTLVRALESGRMHHAYRFEGPNGVGKELAAFAFAQSMVCTAGGRLGCGECPACLRAVRISEDDPRVPQHPDVILVQRGLYPPSLLGGTSREAAGIGVEQIRRIVLSRAGFSPHEARALVFIVRDAEELTVSAANALLKTLEEPASYVHFILLTSEPARLLDTIRSRTLAVRFAPLSEAHVARLLSERGLPADAAPFAQGSMATALSLSDADQRKGRAEFVEAALQAATSASFADCVAFASNHTADRDSLRGQLFGLAQHLSLVAREAAGRGERDAPRMAQRYQAVLEAMSGLAQNGQPVLVLESMLSRMRSA